MSKLIFDIGCNVGLWTNTNYNTTDFFVCVDANPVICKQAMSLHEGKKNVVVLNLLMSSIGGLEEDFYVANNHWASTSSMEFLSHGRFSKVFSWDDPIKIKTSTLDLLIQEYGVPNHIKIDVEGYELMVLNGLTNMAQMISFEWNEEEKLNTLRCINHLHALGYNKFSIHEEDSYTYIPDQWVDVDTILNQTDALLVADRFAKWGMIYAI